MMRHLLTLLTCASLALMLVVVLLPSPDPALAPADEGPGALPSDWFWQQRAFPHGEISPAGQRLAIEQAAAMREEATLRRLAGGKRSLDDAVWQQAGPTNVGARVTDLAPHPTDADICYAAMATGGIFVTTDAGQTWSPIFDQGDVITIGDIVLDPQDPDVIYAGTGEANANSYSFFGTGLYRSPDAGQSWEHLGLEDTRYIARVLVDPTDNQRLFVAATGKLFGTGPNRGVFRSTDGGASWDRVFALTDSTACTDLAMHPTNPQILYAAMWERVRGRTYRRSGGPSSGLWRSLDGGDSWQELTSGLPTGSNVGRIGVSICTSQPNVLYAIYADASASFEGVYKSVDGGDTWTATNDGALAGIYSTFGWYFGQIRVDPSNPDNVFALGVPMYRSTNGGSSWFEEGGNMHVDHHALEFCPGLPTRAYQGNDGGLYRSDDSGSNWTKLYDQPTQQFYAIEIDYLEPARLYGGTQDNGTLRTPSGQTDDWERIFGGDGFVTLVDPTDSDVIYCEYQYGNLFKSVNGGATFSFAMDGIDTGDRSNWNTPFVLDPSNPQTLYFGTYRVYRSDDGADSWSAISGDLTDGDQGANFGTITTLAVAPSSPAVIYAGTDDGHVWVYRPFNGQWVDISAGLPRRWVTRVTVDPTDHRVVYATFSGLRWDEPISHVYGSENGGLSWSDASGDLPEAPVNAILVDPDHPEVLYVGTDVGVYVSENTGATWRVLGQGLPRAPVLDLKLHQPSRTLAAGTHGRSIFTTTVEDITTPVQDLPAPPPLAVTASPNPFNPRTELSFILARGGAVALEIYSPRGARLARPFSGRLEPGPQTLSWDGRDEAGRNLASGVYLARLTTPEGIGAVKLVLAK
jgi:photosystem II stability/assembly factor-like uncharacterized protein